MNAILQPDRLRIDLPGVETPIPLNDFLNLSREDKISFMGMVEELERRDLRRRFDKLFPDEATVWRGEKIPAREGYTRHLIFFDLGSQYRERCFMAGNRVGKSEAGGFEITSHLTGLYRHWWTGRVFGRPVKVWAAGKTNETTRDILQAKLLGKVIGKDPRTGRKGVDGTGIIPGDLIGDITWKTGIPDQVDTVQIKHISGGWSMLGFKSYNQGRGSFEGTEQDVIWLDEEPPNDVYGECLIRTATTNGLILLTFTPLEGLSEVVLSFLPSDMTGSDA